MVVEPLVSSLDLNTTEVSFISNNEDLKVEIDTPRLRIRSYEDQDFEECVALYSDPKITKYFDHGQPLSRVEVWELVSEKGSKYFKKKQPLGLFSIFFREDMCFMGQADLLPTGEPGTVEIGCILHRKYHYNGYAREACKALVIDYVEELNRRGVKLDQLPISQVIATTHPKNYASQKLIKSVGLTFYKDQERFGNPRFWYSLKNGSAT